MFLWFQILLNYDPGPIYSSVDKHLLCLNNPFGPAITRGFLKFLFICLLRTWNIFAGFVGNTTEKLAD